jgi:hypothetical protein
MLRKLIAIALLAIFGLPFATSLFALTPKNEANLPACCRRNGKHHCMMSAAERSQVLDSEPGFRVQPEQCPYTPVAMMGAHHSFDLMPVSSRQLIYAELVSHPADTAQTESKFRIARDRARGKRGPPSSQNF